MAYAGAGAALRTAQYEEYGSLEEMWREQHGTILESLRHVTHQLSKHWHCVIRRIFPYSEGSKSFVLEVFLLLKSPVSPGCFKAQPNGRVQHIKADGTHTDVYRPQRTGGLQHIFLMSGSTPLRLCSVMHGGDKYRVFRYSLEFHCEKLTKAKGELQAHLQEHSMTIFPAITGDYLSTWWLWKECKSDFPRMKYRDVILAYTRLAEQEARDRVQRAEQAQQKAARQHVDAQSPPATAAAREREEQVDDEVALKLAIEMSVATAAEEEQRWKHNSEAADAADEHARVAPADEALAGFLDQLWTPPADRPLEASAPAPAPVTYDALFGTQPPPEPASTQQQPLFSGHFTPTAQHQRAAVMASLEAAEAAQRQQQQQQQQRQHQHPPLPQLPHQQWQPPSQQFQQPQQQWQQPQQQLHPQPQQQWPQWPQQPQSAPMRPA
eukprot:TRINITY_DN17_c0_g3_i7.p1 TRINITY_DN17_c0_g3~~TRINITY_DN17_c0_g3_i7.p1  ORF type:complete len:437 (+),score=144.92 TRINITY_DN17_c0_g3_i7:81-1391(+)